VGGARIIDRVAAAMRAITDELLLVANATDAETWLPGVPVRADRRADGGGLAGVETALELGRDLLVVAWDMPFVTPALLRALRDAAAAPRASIVAPESGSPHGFEPFCAFYSHAVRGALTKFLDGGGGPAHAFVKEQPDARFLAPAEIAPLGDPAWLFFSVNTAAELERARAMAARAQ
jgi:molybdopterin-guanine dinucleotide biosynthesis protein A